MIYVNIEDKIQLLNYVQEAYNWGKYDPCHYLYIETLHTLINLFRIYEREDYLKATKHILHCWKTNQDVPRNAFVKLIKAIKNEIR